MQRARSRVEVCKAIEDTMRSADLVTYHLRVMGVAEKYKRQSKRARDIMADLLKNCV